MLKFYRDAHGTHKSQIVFVVTFQVNLLEATIAGDRGVKLHSLILLCMLLCNNIFYEFKSKKFTAKCHVCFVNVSL